MPLLVRRRRAASFSNYALLVGLIATVSIGAVVAAGGRTGCLLQQASFGLVGDESACAPAGPPVSPPPPGGGGENRAPQVSDRTLPRANLGAAVSAQMQGADPDGDPLTWTLGGGTLPAGLTLGPDGLLSGIPTEGGVFSFTVVAADAEGLQDSGQITLAVNRPPAVASAGLLPPALVAGTPVSIALSGSDPDGDALTWSLAGGALPAGLALAPGGTIAGTPTGAGAAFTVRAQDSDGLFATAEVRLNAAPAFSTPAALPLALAGQPLSQALGASDPDGQPVAVSLVAGALPDGVSLSPEGLLTGAPVAGGSFAFTAQAADPDGATATRAFTLEVGGAPTFLTAEGLLGSYAIGAPASFAVAAEDTVPGALSYALTATSVLPDGLLLAADGTITGVPTAGGTTFTVRVTNAASGLSADRAFRLNAAPVLAAGPTLQALAGEPLSLDLGAQDPDGPAPVVALAAGTLPDGLSLSAEGVIAGTPAAGGASSFTISATDADGAQTTRAFTLEVQTPPEFATPAGLLASYVLGGPLSLEIVAADPLGGTVSFALAGTSALPDGLALGADGVLSGTPTSAGTTFTVRATASGSGLTRERTFRLNAAPQIQTPAGLLDPGYATGVAYDYALAATDPEGGPLVWSLASGVLPTGLSLDPAGRIQGTVAVSETQGALLRATDTDGAAAEVLLTVAPDLRPRWTTAAALPTATNQGVSYNVPVQATGQGTIRYTVAEGSALPAGMTLNASTGRIQGSPTGAGGQTASVVLRATDGQGRFRDQTFQIPINDRPRYTSAASTFAYGPFPTGTPITPIQLPVADGDDVPTCVLTSSSPPERLPAGLSMGPGCVISGTPTSANSIGGRWQVTDGKATGPGNPVVRVTTYVPNFNLTPFTFADLSYASFAAPAQDTATVTLAGGFTETLTARLVGPRAATLRINGVDRGTGTDVSFAVGPGGTVQIRGVQNPSGGAFDSVEEYTLSLSAPGIGTVYETTFAAAGPSRVMAVSGLSFSAIATQALGATNVQTSVPLISGFNDAVRLRASGDAAFTLRVGGSSGTCTSNPTAAPSVSSAAGEEVTTSAGAIGQATNTQIRVCLSGLSAPANLSESRSWTIAVEDPQTGETLALQSVTVATPVRDPVPTVGAIVTTAASYLFGATVDTGRSIGNNVTTLTGFNTQIRAEVFGPRPASIRQFTSTGVACSNTPANASGTQINPTLTFGTNLTAVGAAHNFGICVRTTAPLAFDAAETYELRLVDPTTNETVASTSFQVRAQSRDLLPNAITSLGTSSGNLPYGTVSASSLRAIDGFNAPVRLAVSAPAGAGIGAALRAGTSAASCTANPVVATALAGQTVQTAGTFGSDGAANTIHVCLQNIGAGPAFSSNQVYTVSVLDPITGATQRSTTYTLATLPRDTSPTLASSFGPSSLYHTDQLPGATLVPPSNSGNTLARISAFNAALEGVFHGPRAFALRTSTDENPGGCGVLGTIQSSTFNPETNRHEVRIPYDPNGVSPGRGSGVGIDGGDANRLNWCFNPGTMPPNYAQTETYGADFLDPSTGAVVLSSATTPGAAMNFTTLARNTVPTSVGAGSISNQDLNRVYLQSSTGVAFSGLTAQTRLRVIDQTPGFASRIAVGTSSTCPALAGGNFPAAASDSVLVPGTAGPVNPNTLFYLCYYHQTPNAYGASNVASIVAEDPETGVQTQVGTRTRATLARDETFETFPTFPNFTTSAGAADSSVTYFANGATNTGFAWRSTATVNVPYALRVSGPRPLALFSNTGTSTSCATASGAVNRNPTQANTLAFSPTTYALPHQGGNITPNVFLCIQSVRRPAAGQTDTYTVEALEIDRLTGATTTNVLRTHTFTVTAP